MDSVSGSLWIGSSLRWRGLPPSDEERRHAVRVAPVNVGAAVPPHLPEIIGDETVIMHEFSQQVKKVLDSMKD